MGTPVDIAGLLKRVEALEAALGIHPPPMRVGFSLPGLPNLSAPNKFGGSRCSKCGIDWSGAMGYVCGMQDCPTQSKVSCAA